MIIGSFSTVLSSKRRCAVPRKFLKELGKNLVLAKWYEGCLVLVGKDRLNALLNRLTAKEEIVTAPVRDTDRFILGSAYELTADNQGRVVVPNNLVQYAKLGTKVIFLGLRDRIEIWNEKTWQEREKYVSSHAGEFVERLANAKK